jgi:GNAT superfamily N-acetyltransferase
MDHIPVGEIAFQLPMFIDPTMIVDNVLAGYRDATDAPGNSPYVGDPEGLWERKRAGAAHGRLHRGRPPQPRPRLLGRSGLRRRHRRPAPRRRRAARPLERVGLGPGGSRRTLREAQVNTLEHYVDNGGIALGAFASGRLVGIGVVVPHLRPRIAQLAFLHVSAPLRATGIGSCLSEQLEQIARTAGDSDMVASATPSENTGRFYLGRGFQPMAEPLAELFELEPDDVHMSKVL